MVVKASQCLVGLSGPILILALHGMIGVSGNAPWRCLDVNLDNIGKIIEGVALIVKVG